MIRSSARSSHVTPRSFGRAGYTLLEVVISLGVFSIMVVVLGQTFAGYFQAYRSARALQRNVEVAQHAMQIMAKELRTSSIVTIPDTTAEQSANAVIFFDHSQKMCFRYSFSGGSLMKQVSAAATPTLANCGVASWDPAAQRVTSGYAEGSFISKRSHEDAALPANNQVGYLTVVLEVKERAADTKKAMLQTTVSLRDYGQSGLF